MSYGNFLFATNSQETELCRIGKVISRKSAKKHLANLKRADFRRNKELTIIMNNINYSFACLSLALALLAATSSAAVSPKGYIKLESILKRLPDQSVDGYIAKVHRMHGMLNSDGSIDPHLVEAIEAIVAVCEIPIDAPKCDYDEYGTLLEASEPSSLSERKTKRVKQIIDSRRLVHAQKCLPKYRANFEKVYAEVGKEYTDLVEGLMRSLSLERQKPFVGNQQEAANVAKFMSKHKKEANAGESKEELYKRFIDGPCEHYYWQTGGDLFELAEFDAQTMGGFEVAFAADSSESAFFEAFYAYKACKAIFGYTEFMAKVLSQKV